MADGALPLSEGGLRGGATGLIAGAALLVAAFLVLAFSGQRVLGLGLAIAAVIAARALYGVLPTEGGADNPTDRDGTDRPTQDGA